MNTTKKITLYVLYITVSLTMIFSIMSFLVPSINNTTEQQKVLKYEGTYGLYIEKTDHYNFHWITQSEGVGIYEVLDKSKRVIASGETSSSRTHSIDLEKKIAEPFTFRFGRPGKL